MFSPRRGMRLFISQSLEASAQLQRSKSRAMQKETGLLILKLLVVVLIQPISAETEGRLCLLERVPATRFHWGKMCKSKELFLHSSPYLREERWREGDLIIVLQGAREMKCSSTVEMARKGGSEIQSGARLSHVTHCDRRGGCWSWGWSHGIISIPLLCHWHFLFHAQLWFNLLIAILWVCLLFHISTVAICKCANIILSNFKWITQPQIKPMSSLKLCLPGICHDSAKFSAR